MDSSFRAEPVRLVNGAIRRLQAVRGFIGFTCGCLGFGGMNIRVQLDSPRGSVELQLRFGLPSALNLLGALRYV